jgi:transcription initiation factor TFIID subunit 2
MDLSVMDESPVLWIRLDPDMTLMRHVNCEQPDFQWQFQLRHERDVTAQLDAIDALEKYATVATRVALTDVIENEMTFYEVRCEAAKCLTKVANAMHQWQGPPAMLSIFRKLFGSFSAPHIVRQNNFDNFQHYFLQKTIPKAMAGLRTAHGICPPEIMRFLLDLFKYNDNAKNHYSDVYYRAALIDALGESITPVISVIQQGAKITSDNLTPDSKLILEEITKILNLEKHLPSYKYTASVSCLKVIRKLQKCGHLPANSKIYRSYSEYGHYIDLRLAALECLVDFIKADGKWDDMEFIVKLLENDHDPEVRHQLSRLIVENPPFERGKPHRLNRHDLRERIWTNMNSKMTHDTRLRCDFVDVYYALYGIKEPAAIKNPELAALYQPQKEVQEDNENMKIEMVDAKDIIINEPGIEGIEVVTELMEVHDTSTLLVETPNDEIQMKIEDEFKIEPIVETLIPERSQIFASEEPPIAKRIKVDYGSDSQSQPSIDMNDMMAAGPSGGEFSGTKEHKAIYKSVKN